MGRSQRAVTRQTAAPAVNGSRRSRSPPLKIPPATIARETCTCIFTAQDRSTEAPPAAGIGGALGEGGGLDSWPVQPWGAIAICSALPYGSERGVDMDLVVERWLRMLAPERWERPVSIERWSVMLGIASDDAFMRLLRRIEGPPTALS